MKESGEALDRVAPTRRPAGTPSGTQSWRELLFVHWALPAAEVRARVPKELELDLWNGEAWVGLVPFQMRQIRTAWMPRAAAMDFLETNLRTYVHHRGEPGVYFFSLEASSFLAVHAARLGWGLPYHFAQMQTARDGARVTYGARRHRANGAGVSLAYEVGDPLPPSQPGSLEFFLLERYLLFSHRRGAVHRGQVHHPPYPAQRASLLHLDEGLLAAAGLTRPAAPAAVHYAEGVDVEVFGPVEVSR